MQPRFITLEGGEGAGKSTQLRWLAESFEKAGLSHIATREPGGSPGAESIRQLLVTGSADRWHEGTEALLFMAARYDHIATLIQPALLRGDWVLCDRFYDSTLIYQGIGKSAGVEWLNHIYHLLYGTLQPDVTLLLDVPPSLGLARAASRHGNETRFESMHIEYHQTIRDAFLARAAEEDNRFLVLDAAQEAPRVHQQIINALNQLFRLSLPLVVKG